MSPHDAETDATRCYPLTGRHLQVAAILGHQAHGGRVRRTVTQARQIGELVAWGECQAPDSNRRGDSRGPDVPRTDEPPTQGQCVSTERDGVFVTVEMESA